MVEESRLLKEVQQISEGVRVLVESYWSGTEGS